MDSGRSGMKIIKPAVVLVEKAAIVATITARQSRLLQNSSLQYRDMTPAYDPTARHKADVVFVQDPSLEPMQFMVWQHCCNASEQAFISLLNLGVAYVGAASVLTDSVAVTCRVWGTAAAWKQFIKSIRGVEPWLAKTLTTELRKEKPDAIFKMVNEVVEIGRSADRRLDETKAGSQGAGRI